MSLWEIRARQLDPFEVAYWFWSGDDGFICAAPESMVHADFMLDSINSRIRMMQAEIHETEKVGP